MPEIGTSPPVNRYYWRSARTAEVEWTHPYLPKPTAPWCVVRTEAGEDGFPDWDKAEIVLPTPTRVLADDIALLMGVAFYDGRLQERRWWESQKEKAMADYRERFGPKEASRG